MKKENKEKKDHKRLLHTIICQQNEQPRKNGQVLRKVQSSTSQPGRNTNYEQTNHKDWN